MMYAVAGSFAIGCVAAWVWARRAGVLPKDRRRAPRVPFDSTVILDARGKRIACRTQDLSIRGLQVALPLRLPVGTAMRVDFGSSLGASMGAELCRINEDSNDRGVFLWGIRFTRMPMHVRAAIRHHVHRRRSGAAGAPIRVRA